MSDRLLVATRKGLFDVRADGEGRWNFGDLHFAGEPVSMVLPDPRDSSLYAALNLGHFGVKLHRRREGMADWEECAVPVYPPQPADETHAADGAHASAGADSDDEAAPSRPATPWTLQQIWSLETGGPDEPGVLWAGTIPGGLFRSGDGGDTWVLNRALWDRPERREWFGGGYDAAGIHSVMVDPRDSRHVTIGVSCGGVWQTDDGGASWRVSAEGMEADYMPPERRGDANVQDPHRVVQCPANPRCVVDSASLRHLPLDRRCGPLAADRSAAIELRLRGCRPSARPGHRVVRACRERRVPHSGGRPIRCHAHTRRRAHVRAFLERAAAEPGV